MKQADLDYLKGFTLLQGRDALSEAWSVLKQAKKQQCPACGGSGVMHPRRFQVQCYTCKGTGVVTS